MWLVSTAALAATVYKWVDENGVTHYSDQPHPKAEKVQITEVQTYEAPPVPEPARSEPRQPQATGYLVCELAQPQEDEVFFNTDTVVATVRLDPELQSGHRIAVALDGRRAADLEGGDMSVTLSPVYRGTHTLMATVEDASTGQTICQTPAVTFHVRQPSVLAPNPANRPRF